MIVESWLIEDGQYPFPEIGDRATYVAKSLPAVPDGHGLFEADFIGAPDGVDVTGTVVGRRIVTVTTDPLVPGYPPSPDRTMLSDVPEELRGFDSGLVPTRVVHRNPDGSGWVTMEPPTDRPWVRESGVLVDLDIHA